jgi:hypothetical protein
MPLLTLCHVVRTSGLLGPERVTQALKSILTVSEQKETSHASRAVCPRLDESTSKRPVGGLGLLLDVFHSLTVTSWTVNLRHAAPILTTKLGRTNHYINDRFI